MKKSNDKKTLSGSRRGDLVSRLNQLASMLSSRWCTQEELAREFGVSLRTIRRDIDVLSSRYYLEEDRRERKIFYRIKNNKFVPPELTEAELSTLVLAEEVTGESGLTAIPSPFASDFDSLMKKVKMALSEERRIEIEKLKSVLGSATSPAKDFRNHKAKINRLLKAAIECFRVRMIYHSLSSDQETERLFEPYSIYYDPDGSTIKVIGFDHRRKGIIPFSIDHIRRLCLTKQKFQRPESFSLREFLAENCFNGIHGEPINVRLRARGVTARIFDERKFHRTQITKERKTSKDDKLEEITIEMRVASGRGLLRFVLSWGNEVEILAPKELRQQLAETYKRALALYSDVSSDSENETF
jgi:proteasome accessory factor B